jgi:tetratricopeptide (TPR) repeat protein
LEKDYIVNLEPGGGRRLTKEEVLTLAKGGTLQPSGGSRASGTPTASATPATSVESEKSNEDKAKRAEIERKNAEIAAKNAKIEQSNVVVARTFKAGNEALKAKRYDEALAQYNEGLAADPEHPVLLTSKARALTLRGVDRYNTAIKASDNAGVEAAKKDFSDAAEAGNKAVELIKAEPAATDQAGLANQNLIKGAALLARAEAMRLFAIKVDKTQLDAAFAAYQEYAETLTDPAKKMEAQLMAAKILYDGGQPDKALVEYQKILAADPNNVEASLYAGLALYSSGDKTKYQEAANYLQQFVDKALDTHPMKASAKEVLDNLKAQEKVTPVKGGRRRG